MVKELSLRALGRATLDRQFLLRRTTHDPARVVEHLVGLQTQIPPNHYTALWSRVADFDAEDFSRRFEAREFVRISLQRSTIHTVTARDCLALRPVLRDVQERVLRSAFGKKLAGVDLDQVAARARELVEQEPRTFSELGRILVEDRPGGDPQALAMAARHLLPLVQVPPRGLWGRGGLQRHTTADHWLGAPMGASTAPDELVMRYFAAFGPASVADAQTWSGLTRLAEVVDRHRHELITFRDEGGTELFDLPGAPRPDPGVPAPPRFLPEFDNVFIGHKDRRRIVPDEARKRFWGAHQAYAVFLADGLLQGSWRLDHDKRRARTTLVLRPFAPLPRTIRDDLEDEGTRLASFHHPGTADLDIRWEPHTP